MGMPKSKPARKPMPPRQPLQPPADVALPAQPHPWLLSRFWVLPEEVIAVQAQADSVLRLCRQISQGLRTAHDLSFGHENCHHGSSLAQVLAEFGWHRWAHCRFGSDSPACKVEGPRVDMGAIGPVPSHRAASVDSCVK